MTINSILKLARRVARASLSTGVATSSLAMAAAHAATTVYTDRAAFEAALGAFSVDDLTGIPSGPASAILRSEFTITAPNGPGMFGCVDNPVQCGSLSPPGVDAVHFHHCQGEDTFTFDIAIHGLGFDFFTQTGGAPSIDGHLASGA